MIEKMYNLAKAGKNKALAAWTALFVAVLVPASAFAADTFVSDAETSIKAMATDTVSVIGAALIIVALAIVGVSLVMKLVKRVG